MKPIRLKTKLLFFSLWLCFCCPAATAQSVEFVELNKRVSPASRVTYLDLLQKIFPAAQADAGAGSAIADKSIELRGLRDESQKNSYTGKLEIRFWDGFRTPKVGGKYLIALLGVSPQPPTNPLPDAKLPPSRENKFVLALFRLRPQPEFLDAVEIEQKLVWIRLEASNLPNYFWVVDGFSNCCTHAKTYTLVRVENDRLKMGFDRLHELFDSETCGYQLRQKPFLAVSPKAGKILPAIRLTVVSSVKEFDEKCAGRVVRRRTKFFRYELAWDAKFQKYFARINPAKAIRRELVKWDLLSGNN